MSPNFVRCHIENFIATVTIDRPPVNALNLQAYEELGQVFRSLNGRTEVRVVILASASEKAFVAGSDAQEFQALTPQGYPERARRIRETFWAIYDCEVPVIGAINGPALGGGLAIAAMCDVLIASEKASFGLPEINVGMLGGAKPLARLVPQMKARKMLYTGERLSAQEVYRLGAVDSVVSPAELMPAARRLAEEIAEKSPIAIRLAKKGLNAVEFMDLKKGYEFEQTTTGELSGYEDSKEAARAFLEKRKPIFKNR